MLHRRIVSLVITALSFILLSPPEAISEPPKFGFVIPLTGQYAPLGEDCRLGVKAFEASLSTDSRNYAYVFGDAQSDPKSAINEFQRMIQVEKITAAYMVRTPLVMAVNPISAKFKVPLLGGSAHPKFVSENPYSIQLWATTEEEGGLLAKYASKISGYRHVALLTMQDDWMLDLRRVFREQFLKSGGEISIDELFEGTQFDLSSVISRIKRSNSDAVFINGGIEQQPILIKKLREQGVTLPVISNFWIGKPEAIKLAGAALEGTSFFEMRTDYTMLKAGLQAVAPSARPSAVTLSCYLSAAYFAQLSAESKGDSKVIRESIFKDRPLLTPLGTFELKDRKFHFELRLKRIHNGEAVEVPFE